MQASFPFDSRKAELFPCENKGIHIFYIYKNKIAHVIKKGESLLWMGCVQRAERGLERALFDAMLLGVPTI